MKKFRSKTGPGAEDQAVHVYAAQYDGSNMEEVLEIFGADHRSSVVKDQMIVLDSMDGVVAVISLSDWAVIRCAGGSAYIKTDSEFKYNYVAE